jgi:hypothetical protein
MTHKNKIAVGVAAMMLAATTSFAMAQATGKENNATTGSEAGVGPASGAENKGTSAKTHKPKHSTNAMEHGQPTSAGTTDAQAKNLRGHSETPTTGK